MAQCKFVHGRVVGGSHFVILGETWEGVGQCLLVHARLSRAFHTRQLDHTSRRLVKDVPTWLLVAGRMNVHRPSLVEWQRCFQTPANAGYLLRRRSRGLPLEFMGLMPKKRWVTGSLRPTSFRIWVIDSSCRLCLGFSSHSELCRILIV